MDCADGRRRLSYYAPPSSSPGADGRRLSSSATVSFDIDIPADEVADDVVADGADLATTVAATLETAISDGSFATAIASAATSLSVSSMSAVSATGVSVDTQMPTPAPTTPEQTPAPEKRHAARSSLGRWLGRACSQASCVGPASSFDDHTVRMGFRRGHSSHHAGVSMATVRHYLDLKPPKVGCCMYVGSSHFG